MYLHTCECPCDIYINTYIHIIINTSFNLLTCNAFQYILIILRDILKDAHLDTLSLRTANVLRKLQSELFNKHKLHTIKKMSFLK